MREAKINLARCERGHYFDGSKYTSCPHCGVNISNHTTSTLQKPSSVTVTNAPAADPEGITVCRSGQDETVTLVCSTKDDDLRTVVKYSNKYGTRMVVGWLLCTKGVDRGADHRLYAGNNTIGRGDVPDIRLYDDPEICRGVHCTVTYDPKQNRFFILPGAGTVIRLNDEIVSSPRPLSRYDQLEIGRTRLTFVPYCEGRYHW